MELANKEYVEGCKCSDVSRDMIDRYEETDIKKMIKIMDKGLGLAAPQVGINKRFFIMKYQGEIISVYNPKINFFSKQKTALKEGCLTYPQGIHGTVNMMRSTSIQVEFTGKNGNIFIWRLRGLEAKVFQHELDHLNGLTIFYRG